MPGERRALDPLENRLKAELSPEEFVTTVTVMRKIDMLDRVTTGALYLLWFLCVATMGLYYLLATGRGRLPDSLITGLARSTVGQVIALLILIVRGLMRDGSTKVAKRPRKQGH